MQSRQVPLSRVGLRVGQFCGPVPGSVTALHLADLDLLASKAGLFRIFRDCTPIFINHLNIISVELNEIKNEVCFNELGGHI